MAGSHLRFAAFAAFAILFARTGIVAACPFCGGQGQTLTGELADASLVVFGTLENAKADQNNEFGNGTTDLRIEAIVKDHEIRGGKKLITLPRFLPRQDKDEKFLVFCGVFKGKIDPYRGMLVKNDSIVKYLQGAVALKDKPIGQKLRFAFDFLDNAESEVALDAYKEFANADYKDYRAMAKDLPREKILKWLQDPDTPAFRFGLYASLLGHCGKDSDALVLQGLLDDKQQRVKSGFDGMMAGYTMLKPKEGWAYTKGVMSNPKEEFMRRYAALRAARFLWSERPDLVEKKELVAGVLEILKQQDMADLAIEDLRRWQRWEVHGDVLKLWNEKSHNVPIIRRAIVRYALSCEKTVPWAAAFIKDLRAKDAELVEGAEELLRLENSVPKPATTQTPDQPKQAVTPTKK
jgi:hypothetical protein